MLQKVRSTFSADFSFFMAVPGVIWQVFFCLVPLLLIAAFSIYDVTTFQVTMRYFIALFDYVHLKMIFLSSMLALGTTLNCLVIGYPIAFYIARKVEHYKNLFLFFLIIPFWTNLLILVYSWIFILEKNGILNSFLKSIGLVSEPFNILNSLIAVALVTFYCYLPFMVLPLYTALEKIDDTLLEASADLGANRIQTFFKVIVPLSWSGIRTGCFLVYVPVFGEYVVPLLMGGDKYMFVGSGISHYVFTALNISQGAAFTLLAGFALLSTVVLLNIVLKKIIFTL
ncbi:MAG: ABC transporter permease [Candidatus Babeliales bacterium]